MAYCTVKCVSLGVPFPGDHDNTFFRFTEENTTLMGLGREDETGEKEIERFRV